MTTTPVRDVPLAGADLPPRLADGVELIGEFRGSGYREPRYLACRPDGQVVALPRPLFLLAGALDGRRGPAEVAAHLRTAHDLAMDADTVTRLVETRLAPAGVAGAGAGRVTVASPRPDPLLMLRFRLPVVPEHVVWRVAGVAAPLFHPTVVGLALAAFVAVDVALLLTAGLDGLTGAALGVVQAPAAALWVVVVLLLAGVLHECGHVGACRYGGARPGPMGVGIYLVWPAYYSTVTDSYRLGRGGRLRVDLGGVYVNALIMAALGGAHLATGTSWLLIAALVLHVETARQFLPSIRLDGYYILSDLVGLPDLFMFLRPVLSGLLPGRPEHPRVAELTPRARRTIVAWTVLIVPFLASFVVLFVVLAPRVLPAVVAGLGEQLGTVAAAVRTGDPTLGVLHAFRALFLLLPVLGGGLLVGLAVRRVGGWLRATPRPRNRGPRHLAPFAVAATAVALFALLAAAGLDQRPARGGEAALAAASTDPSSPAAALIGAAGVLLGQPGGVLDTARAVGLAAGVLTTLLLWPVARRLGLPGPAAALAVALAGLPALVTPLYGAVDPGATAALLLTGAVALAGRGRGASAAAVAGAAGAVVVAPVAAVGLLGFAAHGAVTGQVAGAWRRPAARVVAGLLAVTAVVAGVLLVRPGAASVPPPLVAGGLAAAVPVVGLAAWRVRRLRPVATGAGALLAVAAVPGAHSVTALLIALPAVAVLAGVLARRAAGRHRTRPLTMALAGVLALAAAASGPAVTAAAAPDPDRHRLAGWVGAQLPADVPVAAPPLVAAQLRADGVAVDRLDPGAALVVGAAGPGALVEFPGGPAGDPVAVHGPPPVPGDPGAGAALAADHAVRTTPEAAARLRAGGVDGRLVTALAGLAGPFDLAVGAFPAVPGEPDTAPRRRAVVTAVDGEPAARALAAVTRRLDGGRPPLPPVRVEPGPDGITLHVPVGLGPNP